jgi:hypothetical protein
MKILKLLGTLLPKLPLQAIWLAALVAHDAD